jgi:hypothetical protein
VTLSGSRKLPALESLDLSRTTGSHSTSRRSIISSLLPLKQCHSLKSLDLSEQSGAQQERRRSRHVPPQLSSPRSTRSTAAPSAKTTTSMPTSSPRPSGPTRLLRIVRCRRLHRAADSVCARRRAQGAPPLRHAAAARLRARRRRRRRPHVARPHVARPQAGSASSAAHRRPPQPRVGHRNTGSRRRGLVVDADGVAAGSFFLDSLDSLEYPIHLDLSSDALDLESAELGKLLGDVLDELNLSNNRLSSAGVAQPLLEAAAALSVATTVCARSPPPACTRCTVLDLSHNELRHVPPCGDARALRVLRLAHNHIAQGFDELTHLRALQVLDFCVQRARAHCAADVRRSCSRRSSCARCSSTSRSRATRSPSRWPSSASGACSSCRSLRWYATRFVSESDRVAAQQSRQERRVEGQANAVGGASSSAARRRRRRRRRRRLAAPAAARQAQGGPRHRARRAARAQSARAGRGRRHDAAAARGARRHGRAVCDAAATASGRFVHQGAPDDSIGSLLKTMHTTWSKSAPLSARAAAGARGAERRREPVALHAVPADHQRACCSRSIRQTQVQERACSSR